MVAGAESVQMGHQNNEHFMKLVSVFMDVEDPINPLSDDAALDFPILFDEVGVKGSFCLTGEKCRTLQIRDQADVANAYRPHSLGLHTNGHSFHPTTMELLGDLDWEEGCKAASQEESKGFEESQKLFGRNPTFWGGAGNTWSPEITEALKFLGIPAYVYALTQFPDHAVHQFNGVLALPQALSISENDWADDKRAQAASDRVLEALQTIPQLWVGIFVGHPTKFRHHDYWDKPYYGGRTPSSPEFVEPVSEDTYVRAKANLRTFLEQLKSQVKVIGVDEVVELPWQFNVPTSDQMSYFESKTSASLRSAVGWPPHRPGLSAEKIVEKTMALKGTLKTASLY